MQERLELKTINSLDDKQEISQKIHNLTQKFALLNQSNHKIEFEKDRINNIIDKMQNFSGFQKFAMGVSKTNFIVKLLAGAALSIPLILGGVFAHIFYLIIAGSVLAITYLPTIMMVDSLGGKILESKEANKILKSFVEIYFTCIQHLNEIEIEFEACIDEFHSEIDNLKKERFKIDAANQEYKKQNTQLEISNEEYKKLNGKLLLKIEALNASLANLSEVIDLSETQKAAFLQRLNTFIDDKEGTFDKVFERFGRAEKALQLERQKFEDLSVRYDELYKLFAENINLLSIQIQSLNTDIKDMKDTKEFIKEEWENIKIYSSQMQATELKDKKLLADLKLREKEFKLAVVEKEKEIVKKNKELQTLETKLTDLTQVSSAFFKSNSNECNISASLIPKVI